MSNVRILNIVVVIPALIWLSLATYGIHKLNQHKNDEYIRKRPRWVLFGINISLFMGMLSTILMSPVFAFPSELVSIYVMAIAVSCVALNLWCIIGMLTIRSWLIFYHYHLSHFLVESHWKEIIDSKYQSTRNWFVANQHTFGNLQYVARLFGAVHFLMGVMCSVAVVMRVQYDESSSSSSYFQVFTIGMTSIAVLFYAVIVCKTPRFNDYHLIHRESALQSCIIALTVPFAIVANVVERFSNLSVFFAILSSGASLLFFAMLYVSTFWLLSKSERHNDSLRGGGGGDRTDQERNAGAKLTVTFEAILINKLAFDAFMEHLFSEYNMDCMLSFIEFTQFEQYIVSLLDMEPEQLQMLGFQCMKFHAEVPRSDIVWTGVAQSHVDAQMSSMIAHAPALTLSRILSLTNLSTLSLDLKVASEGDESAAESAVDSLQSAKNVHMKMRTLYAKYIESGTALEINISGTLRDEISAIVQTSDEEISLDVQSHLMQTVTVVSNIKNEMQQMLQFSHERLKLKPEYDAVIEEIVRAGVYKD